jgi:hypothetical protein
MPMHAHMRMRMQMTRPTTQAHEYLERAREINPTRVRTVELMGYAHELLGTGQAVKFYKKVSE